MNEKSDHRSFTDDDNLSFSRTTKSKLMKFTSTEEVITDDCATKYYVSFSLWAHDFLLDEMLFTVYVQSTDCDRETCMMDCFAQLLCKIPESLSSDEELMFFLAKIEKRLEFEETDYVGREIPCGLAVDLEAYSVPVTRYTQ